MFLENIKVSNIKSKLKYCGNNVKLHLPVVLSGACEIRIGNNVSIAPFVHIWGQGGVEIGDNTAIASHVAISSLTHPINPIKGIYQNEIIEGRVIIGSNVWIGSHAFIHPGVSIGDNAIIGSGAVVLKDVKKNTLVVGVPAKMVKRLDN